uniref:Uncharacterized protein n=1 Tax=Phlebotomus papatasi TaxID=29031 RepID=A0A1B0DQT8_PHLPP
MNGKRFGGRTSSQISIYDYPEHLNPFYEDEQHKRLRFWKIGRRSDKTKRSNSFSLDGLRDLWTLKSFRLKKKSSTLGVNKTSESPPPLRRTLLVEEHDTDRAYHTLDPSARHTVSVGLNSGFERSARYRSSLQDMSTFQQGSPFSRTDRYRNTMQNGQEFVNRGGSKTPQMSSRYSGNHMAHRPARKKRRAPPPPTPVITTPQSPANEEQKDREKAAEISNLTAEIENFVKSSEAEESKECGEISIPVPVPRREKKDAQKFQVTKTQESEIELRITESTDDLSSPGGEKKSPEREESVKVVKVEEASVKEAQEPAELEPTKKESKEEVVQKEEIKEVKREVPEEDAKDRVKDKSDPYRNVVVEMEKYEIRFAPLKTDDAAGENHRKNPVERQRSVQEIIESINKSQSLLKINYEDDSRVQSIMQDIESQKRDVQRRKSSDSLNRNIRELEQKEQEMRELIKELEEQETSDIPVVVQEFNNNSFDKCVQLREPEEKDQNDNQTKKSSIEWNPLPKPRRSRNLSSEDVDVPT